MREEIRFCGLGGQGIVLAGVILGKACIEAGFAAVQTQSYGPEATGGASRSEVVISDAEIDYPSVLKATILVAMSQPAYDKYGKEIADDSITILDPTYVFNHEENAFLVESTRIAEKMGTRMVANMVMVGVVSEILGLPRDAVKRAIEKNVPSSHMKTNVQALEEGFKEGERIRGLRK